MSMLEQDYYQDLTGTDKAGLVAHSMTAQKYGEDGFLSAIKAADEMVALKKKDMEEKHTVGFLQMIASGVPIADAVKANPRVNEARLQQLVVQAEADKNMTARQDAERSANTAAEIAKEERLRKMKPQDAADVKRAELEVELANKKAEAAVEEQEAKQRAKVGEQLGAEAAATPAGTTFNPNTGGTLPVPTEGPAMSRVPRSPGFLTAINPQQASVIPRAEAGFMTQPEIARGLQMRKEPGFFTAAEEFQKADLESKSKKQKIDSDEALAAQRRPGSGTGPKGEYNRFMAHQTAPIEAGGLGNDEDTAQQNWNQQLISRASGVAAGTTQAKLDVGAKPGNLEKTEKIAKAQGGWRFIPAAYTDSDGNPIGFNAMGEIKRPASQEGVVPQSRMTDAEKTFAGAVAAIKGSIARIKASVNDEWVGPIQGRAYKATQNWVSLPPEQYTLYADLLALTDAELRKRSGAAITEPEFQRLSQFMVSAEMSRERILANLARYEEELNAIINERNPTNSPGRVQPTTAAPAAPAAAAPASTPPPVGATMRGPDGIMRQRNAQGQWIPVK